MAREGCKEGVGQGKEGRIKVVGRGKVKKD